MAYNSIMAYNTVDDLPKHLQAQAQAQLSPKPAVRPPAPAPPAAPAPVTKDAKQALYESAGEVKPGTRARARHTPGKMNKTEAAYAEILNARLKTGEIKWWGFESIKFRLGDNCHLTVDFMVLTANDEWEGHECKGGYVTEDGAIKLKVFKKLYPFFPLYLCKYENKVWAIKEM